MRLTVVAFLLCLTAACTGSSSDVPDGSISQDQAIEIATTAVADTDYSIENHETTAELSDGVWRVAFVPIADTPTDGGGLVYHIDAVSSEVIEVLRQQ